MNKSFKKITAVIIAVILIASVFAITAFAADGDFHVPMPDYDLNIFEQIAAFILGIWKYIMSFLPF